MTPSFRTASGHQRDAKRPFYEKEEERPSLELSILGAVVSLILTNKPTGPLHPIHTEVTVKRNLRMRVN